MKYTMFLLISSKISQLSSSITMDKGLLFHQQNSCINYLDNCQTNIFDVKLALYNEVDAATEDSSIMFTCYL